MANSFNIPFNNFYTCALEIQQMKNKKITYNQQEYVVLVDINNNVLETAPKLETHNNNTPLHRGFSVFLFNKEGKLLIQQRSSKKKTWPKIWSNSCCGHPMLNESNIDACKRKLKFELGIITDKICNILPNFSYKVEKDNIVENELCPVLIAFSNQKPIINNDEIEDISWLTWEEFLKDIKNNPTKYSKWCILEVNELLKNKKFRSFQRKNFIL